VLRLVCLHDEQHTRSVWTVLCLQEVLELAFSILYDPDEALNFVAPNKYEVSLKNSTIKTQLCHIFC